MATEDQRAAGETFAHGLAELVGELDIAAGPVGLVDMQIGQAAFIELLGHVEGHRLGLVVGQAEDLDERRHADADTIGAHDLDHGIDDFQRQAGAVFDRTAVGVGALVGTRGHELLQQIGVGRVHFHHVEAGALGALRGLAVFLDDLGNLLGLERARRGRILQTFAAVLELDIGLRALTADRTRRDRLAAVRVHHFVAHAADVPELQRHATAGFVHGVDHALPAGFLFVGEHARREYIAAR